MIADGDATAAVEAGDVALVTGSTSGIGREVAGNLAAAGATVCVHGRDREKGERVAADLPGDGHAFYRADFADLAAVRDLASEVRADHDRLDVLVNNAGTWQSERRLVAVPSGADVELTFVVNHLAHYLLTHLLVDPLVDTGRRRPDDGDETADRSDTAPRGPARVVTVTSGVHRRGELDLDAVVGQEGPSGVDAYGLSKLANVLFTYELARRLPDEVVANCCHPGAAPATGLAREGSFVSTLGWRAYGVVGRVTGATTSPAEAAATPTFLAGSVAGGDANGEYFEDREPTRSSAASHDRSAQRELWNRSAEWVGLADDERLDA